MTNDEMFKKLWFEYPNDLCNKRKGSKQTALKAMEKLKLDEAGFNKIMDNMRAQIRYDRKDPDAYRWPFLSTYLNQGRYDCDIPSMDTIKERQIGAKCLVEGCNDEVHGPAFSTCGFHINNKDERLRQAYIRTGLDRKSPDFVEECRKYCRSHMNILTGKSEVMK